MIKDHENYDKSMELISVIEFPQSNKKNWRIDGLDGIRDQEYLIEAYFNTSSGFKLQMLPNSISTTNMATYASWHVTDSGGTDTHQTMNRYSGLYPFLEYGKGYETEARLSLIMPSRLGIDRIGRAEVVFWNGKYRGKTESGLVWNDKTTNITYLRFITNVDVLDGWMHVYRRRV